MAVVVECLPERPAEVAQFVATAAGRSFATGDAFERALSAHEAKGTARVFVARAGGRIVAVLPGRVERRLGGTWFRAQPQGTPAGPCFDPALAAHGDAALAEPAHALWRAVGEEARREGWLGGDVTLYGPAAAPGAAMLLPPPEVGAAHADEAHVIDLARGPVAWRAGLDNASRRMLAQAGRRGVTIAPGDAASDLDRVHALFLAQARAWKLARVRPLSFYRALLTPPTDARLWVARLGGEIVCGVLAFVSPLETYAWWSGASPTARAVRAYPAMLARMIEDCGSARVNLGFSGGQARLTDFKAQLGAVAVPVPIVELVPRPRTPWHALLVRARATLKSQRRRAAGSAA
jgi:hypothetical protein